MPTITIPFIGNPTQRNVNASVSFTSGKDQIFGSVIFTQNDTEQLESSEIWVNKRTGYSSSITTGFSGYGVELFVSPSAGKFVSAFNSPANIYVGTTSCGALDSASTTLYGITEAVFSGETFFLIAANASGYYVPNSALSVSTTFTGDTHTNTTIDNISSMNGLYIGQLLTGTNIAANTRIATINVAGSSITVTVATTGTTAGVTITRTHLAKIPSSAYPTSAVSQMVELDGYIFVMGSDAKIYNSNINSVVNWNSSDYIPVSQVSDLGIGIARYKNNIIGFGTSSTEFFYNNGNAYGSPLNRITGQIYYVGMCRPTLAILFQQSGVMAFPSSTAGVFSGIYQLTEDGIKNISNPIINGLLGTTITSFRVFELNNYHYLHVAGSSASKELLYCFENKTWSFPSYNTSTDAVLIVGFGYEIDLVISGNNSSGIIYTMQSNSPVYEDAGAAITLKVQTQPYYLNDGHGFSITEVELIGDTQSSGSSAFYTSADDYGTFVQKGSFDLTAQSKTVRRCGFYKSSVAFKVEDSGNQPWRAQALKVHWEPAVT